MKENRSILVRILSNLDIAIACIAIVILILATFIGVPMRYVAGKPFTWLEEVQSACLVWIVFASAGAAFRTGSHVAIEMIVDRLPAKAQKVWKVCIAVIVTVVIGFLFIQSIGYIRMFLNNGRSTPMLNIPYSMIYIICPVSFILQIVSYIVTAVRDRDNVVTE